MKRHDAVRLGLLGFLVLLIVILPTFIGIELRRQTGDVRYSNDHALQIEEAAKFFIHGQNPYTADYTNTVAHLGGGLGEPALTHFISLPFTVLAAASLLTLEDALLGWHDERLLHLLAYVVAAATLLSLVRGSEFRLLVGTLFFFNPFLALSFIHGYTDILLIAPLFVSGWLLSRRLFFASSVILGLALATRQFAVFFAAFYLIFLLVEGNPHESLGRRARLALVRFFPSVVVAALIVGPFFLAAPSAFIDDTIRYMSGSLPTSYPIRGFGLSQALLANGIVQAEASAPFTIMEIVVTAPTALLLGVWVYRKRSVSAVFFASGVLTLVFLYVSRNFQFNYPGYAFALMTAGLAFTSRERPCRMLKTPDLTLVLPLYREAEHIRESLAEIHRTLAASNLSSEVILLDDASPDETAKIVEAELSKYPEMRLERHVKNLGRGATVREGIRTARGMVVGFIDVDLEVSPVYIPQCVRMILDDEADVVTGLRVYRTSLRGVTRFLSNVTYRTLVRSHLRLPYKDTETGYKFFSRERILPVVAETSDPGWFWDTEIMAQCFRHGLRVEEVPVLFLRRYDKTSTVRLIPDSIAYFKKLRAFSRRFKGERILKTP